MHILTGLAKWRQNLRTCLRDAWRDSEVRDVRNGRLFHPIDDADEFNDIGRAIEGYMELGDGRYTVPFRGFCQGAPYCLIGRSLDIAQEVYIKYEGMGFDNRRKWVSKEKHNEYQRRWYQKHRAQKGRRARRVKAGSWQEGREPGQRLTKTDPAYMREYMRVRRARGDRASEG